MDAEDAEEELTCCKVRGAQGSEVDLMRGGREARRAVRLLSSSSFLSSKRRRSKSVFWRRGSGCTCRKSNEAVLRSSNSLALRLNSVSTGSSILLRPEETGQSTRALNKGSCVLMPLVASEPLRRCIRGGVSPEELVLELLFSSGGLASAAGMSVLQFGKN